MTRARSRTPLLVVAILAAVTVPLAVFGTAAYLAYRYLTVSAATEPVVVRVEVTCEGMSAEEMETVVTAAIEHAVAAVEGAGRVRSESRDDVSAVTLYLRPGHDADLARLDVQRAIKTVLPNLPAGAHPPVLSPGDADELPVLWLTLSGAAPSPELGRLAETVVRDRLLTISGVGDVRIVGLRRRLVRARLDAEKLSAFNLTASDVVEAVRAEQANLPAGFLRGDRPELALRVLGEAGSPEELAKLPVGSRRGRPVLLGDVAVIEDGVTEERDLARSGGKLVVALGVFRSPWADPKSACDAVKGALPDTRRALPAEVELGVAADHSDGACLRIDVVGPAGRSPEATAELLRVAEQAVAGLADVAGVLVIAPGDPGAPLGEATLYVRVAEKSRAREVADAARRALGEKAPGLRARVLDLSRQRVPSRRYPVALVVQGEDWETLRRLAGRIEKELEASGAVTDVGSDDRPPVTELFARIDREKAAHLGVTAREAFTALRLALDGEPVGQFGDGGRRYDVRVLVGDESRDAPDRLDGVRVRAADGRLVPLHAVAAFDKVARRTVLRRYNGRRAVEITANPADGVSEAKALARCLEAAEKARAEMGLPDDYRVERPPQ